MNQPNNADEGNVPEFWAQPDQNQPEQAAGNTPDYAYGAGQDPASAQEYQGGNGPYPSYSNEPVQEQQFHPAQPAPQQPSYTGQQPQETPGFGTEQTYQSTYQPMPTPEPTPVEPAYGSQAAYANSQPTPAMPAYQEQAYGQQQAAYQSQDPYAQPVGYEQGAYQQPGVGPQIPQTPAYPMGAGYAYTGIPPIDQPWYGIDFINASKRFFTKYATFKGRASRGEYWWSILLNVLIYMACGVFLALAPDTIAEAVVDAASVALFVPNIAVAVRRLHDSNMSGLWYLMPTVTTVTGSVFLLIGVAAFATKSSGAAIAFMVLGLVIAMGGCIANLVFMLRSSDPRGARFDK
nr:DUF805 domain-containing protein [Bifidobacterium indicum]